MKERESAWVLANEFARVRVSVDHRGNAPRRQRGQSIVSDDTEGKRVRVTGKVYDLSTRAPVAGATLDVWQAATNGFYENQDNTNPTIISEADSRPTKTAPSNWWHCCRHPTPCRPMGQSANCCGWLSVNPTDRLTSISSCRRQTMKP